MIRHLWIIGLLATMIGGCAAMSADMPDDTPKREKPPATYDGLAGQKIAIVVWADWKTRTEAGFSQIQLDLGRLLQKELEQRALDTRRGKKEKTTGMEFVDPRTILLYQKQHPELTGMPAIELAPKLGAPRVIYIEIEDFSVQSPMSIMLLKGLGKATLRVVEVQDSQAKVALEETGIKAEYPHNAPEGLVPSDQVNARTIYQQTLNLLALKLADRFEVK